MNFDEQLDDELNAALKEFRSSVHGWSEAAYFRPRTAIHAAPRARVWRLVAGWALGCALLVGAVGGGIVEQRHRQELARITAVQTAEQQRKLAVERAREEEDLLAKVDSDVAREVPIAMEPLAQLMVEDESK
jgi:hypothetical protein